MSILKHLRSETDAIHKSIEAQSLAHKIVDLSITEAEYRAHLLHQFEAYSSVELSLLKFLSTFKHDDLFEFCTLEKSNKLKKDFKELNIQPPKNISVTEINLLAEAIGALYVIEGSMLGNLMLSKKIRACENLKHINNFHFYNGNKNESLPRWKQFQNIANSIDFKENEIQIASKKSIEVFKKF